MTFPIPMFAGLFVLMAAASGSGDYVLITPSDRICAKSAETCEAARTAITKGWFLPELRRDAVTVCRAHPGCFPESSAYIDGHNMPAGRR